MRILIVLTCAVDGTLPPRVLRPKVKAYRDPVFNALISDTTRHFDDAGGAAVPKYLTSGSVQRKVPILEGPATFKG